MSQDGRSGTRILARVNPSAAAEEQRVRDEHVGGAAGASDPSSAGIRVAAVSKSFGTQPVLHGIDLEVQESSITAILGPSGSGKTTLLRLIAGFDRVDAGTITIGGQVVDDESHFVRPQHRGVGYVPQEGALFPHLTVKENIGFGVPRRARATMPDLADLVGLTGLERRYPHQLSGGQQQRVALARALAIRPKIVLLDEPFTSLDASLRDGVRRDVLRILAETATTTVLVTHDQDEALAMAQQIAVLREGIVVATADPRTLYDEPPDLNAATFIGEANILEAEVHDGVATCILGLVEAAPPATGSPVEGAARLLLRPEQLVLHLGPTEGAVAATVIDDQYHGHDAVVHLAVEARGAATLSARVPGDLALVQGQPVWVAVRGAGRVWLADDRQVS